MGYKANISGDTRLALGTDDGAGNEGNVFTINKFGDADIKRDTITGGDIKAKDTSQDKNIYTNLDTNAKLYIGSITN